MYFRAKCNNIDHTTVCFVKRSGDSFIFSGKSLTHSVPNISGIISSSLEALLTCTQIIQIENCEELLQEDDILLVRPSGEIRLLYRSNWHSNVIFLTNQCNNQCICCPQPPKSDKEDLLGIALLMIQMITDTSPVLGITGGEPTYVWNNLINVIAFTRKVLPESSLQLLSNARILANYDKTAELASVAEGKLLVCVPLYADVYHIHDAITEVRGSYYEALAGLKNLARTSLNIEVRVVISRQNYTRLPQLANFIYRNLPFVSHVALMGIEMVGHAARHKKDLWVSPSKYMPYLEEAVHMFDQRDMLSSIYNHPLCLVPECIQNHLCKSISEWKVVYPSPCINCSKRADCPGCFFSVAKELETEVKPYRFIQ